jgi:hypothetical protein
MICVNTKIKHIPYHMKCVSNIKSNQQNTKHVIEEVPSIS